MRVETLVDGEQALGAHGLEEAVPGAGVEGAGLVVHSGHYCVCGGWGCCVSSVLKI